MGCMGIINRLYVQYVSLLAHCLYEMLDVKTNTFEKRTCIYIHSSFVR